MAEQHHPKHLEYRKAQQFYNQIRELEAALNEHHWSRSMTNRDRAVINFVDKALGHLANDLYLATHDIAED